MKKFLLITVCLPWLALAQSNKLDSLLNMAEEGGDSVYLALGSDIIKACYQSRDTTTAVRVHGELKQIAENCSDESPLCGSLKKNYYIASGPYASVLYKIMNRKEQAELQIRENIQYQEQIGDLENLARNYLVLGIYSRLRAAYPEALSNYQKSLELYEQLEDYEGQGNIHHNIGNIFSAMENYPDAIRQHRLALSVRREHGITNSIPYSFSSLCLVYSKMQNVDSSLYYLGKIDELGDQVGPLTKGLAYSNVGIALANSDRYDEAIPYYRKALDFRVEGGSDRDVANSKINLGSVLMNSGDLSLTEVYCKEGYEYGQELGDLFLMMNACNCLSSFYEKTGQYKQALEFKNLDIKYHDSISSQEDQLELSRNQLNFTFEKTRIKDSVEFAKQQQLIEMEAMEQKALAEKNQAELDKKKSEQILLFGGIGALALFSIFVINRLQVSRKQKRLIEKQKEEVERQKEEVELQKNIVEVKNNEITDSIQYAKRIQAAILPPDRIFQQHLPNSFVLYKPKDIVSGDFYWMVNSPKALLFAACDCTGHGVPGAMVSVVCNNGLNRAVREHGLTNPGLILDKTREIVVEEFEKSDEEVKDGMDVALCSLSSNKLSYSGANNPLWIIRNGATEVEEIKADKQPIGKFEQPLPYTTHEVVLNQGDSVYIFSDGFADQFGGEKGKKFKTKNFKNLLLSIQGETMENQKQLINQAFEDWKGQFEQLDDVCVIGVRV